VHTLFSAHSTIFHEDPQHQHQQHHQQDSNLPSKTALETGKQLAPTTNPPPSAPATAVEKRPATAETVDANPSTQEAPLQKVQKANSGRKGR